MKSEITKHKLSELIFDYDLYPRSQIDAQHVSYMVASLEAGGGDGFPPIVICAKTRRVVDGFHRCRAWQRVKGEHYEVECVAKRYANEAETLLDAMRYNHGHGRSLTTHDRAHCLILADRVGLTVDQVADALMTTVKSLGDLRTDRLGNLRGDKSHLQPIALKRTIRHMAGKTLTKGQSEANDRLSGMNQSFYVNQIVALIENDLLDLDDADLMEGLRKLGRLIRALPRPEPV